MKFGAAGLAGVSTEDLQQVLARVYDGTLKCPITHHGLVLAGMSTLIDQLGHLTGLDARSTQAVLVAVLAERAAAARSKS